MQPTAPHNLFFIEQLGVLYTDVQSAGLFADSKFFVDAVPKQAPGIILEAYETERDAAGFDLKAFVEKNFILPPPAPEYHSERKPIAAHLHELWEVLKRTPGDANAGTLLPLPHPYIVPGGRFREIYYWDSYFTMLGLQCSGKKDAVRDMVANFAWLIDEVGFIPNGNRSYYLGRSQPPFFALMIALLMEEQGNDPLLQYLPRLEKEYRFWMDGSEVHLQEHIAYRRVVKMPDGTVLNRYWDDNEGPRPEAWTEDREIAARSPQQDNLYRHIRAAAESGWDFSSRWFADPMDMASIETTSLVPVDLNCLLYYLEETLLRAYALLGDKGRALPVQQKMERRKKAIQDYCWNEKEGFYFDYHYLNSSQSQRLTIAAVFPLFFGIATPAQAAAVAGQVEARFLQAGGVLTTLVASGQQWDAPNGWAPLQWIAYKGLSRYGYQALATRIKERWMVTNEKVYASTGKMMEKYDVMTSSSGAGGGEYPNQDGFGWTNGVYLKLRAEN